MRGDCGSTSREGRSSRGRRLAALASLFTLVAVGGCRAEGGEEDVAAPRVEPIPARETHAYELVEIAVRVRDTARAGSAPTVALVDAPPGGELARGADGTHLFRWRPTMADIGEVTVGFEASRPDQPDVRAGAEATLHVLAPDPSMLSRFGEAPPLRDLAAAHGVRIGFAASHDMFRLEDADRYAAIAAEEFDILTPEDSMKMEYLRHVPGRYEWEWSDRLVAFAETHGLAVHGHPLVWSGQVTQWIRDLDREGHRTLMREHVATLASRYRGRIEVWDAVNEAILSDGSPRDSLWYQSMGLDYIGEVFRIAREHDPEATLIYNDYHMGWLNPKSDAVLELLAGELARGTPIDGVGFQLHLDSRFEPGIDSLRENFRRFAELGLDIYITEMDVAVDWREDEQVEAEKQAAVYAEVMRLCLEQPRCRALQIWGAQRPALLARLAETHAARRELPAQARLPRPAARPDGDARGAAGRRLSTRSARRRMPVTPGAEGARREKGHGAHEAPAFAAGAIGRAARSPRSPKPGRLRPPPSAGPHACSRPPPPPCRGTTSRPTWASSSGRPSSAPMSSRTCSARSATSSADGRAPTRRR